MAKKETEYSIKINGIPQANKDLKTLNNTLSDSQKKITQGNEDVNKSILIVKNNTEQAFDANKQFKETFKKNTLKDYFNVDPETSVSLNKINKELQNVPQNAANAKKSISESINEGIDDTYIDLERSLNKGEKSAIKTVAKNTAKNVFDGIKSAVDDPATFAVEVAVDILKDKIKNKIKIKGSWDLIEDIPNAALDIRKTIQDAEREYYSIFDESFHDTLTALDLYNIDYIAKERGRIETLIDFEKEYAEKKLAIQVEWEKNRKLYYKGRDSVNDTYHEENKVNILGNIGNGIIGKFPMSPRQKAEKLNLIEKYKENKNKEHTQNLTNLDYEYGYKSPEAVIYSQVKEEPKRKQTVAPKSVAVTDTRPKPEDISIEVKPLDAEGFGNIAEENITNKEKSLKDFAEKNKKVNAEIVQNSEGTFDAIDKKAKDVAKNVNDSAKAIMQGVNSVFETINMSINFEIEEANEKYKAISEKHNELVEKVKESNDRIKALQEDAKDAQGGHLSVIQEQISREMESHKELADEEKRLAEEKVKAEAEKEKLEKKKKKTDMQQKLIQGLANTALGITQALGASPPPFNFIMAALVGAMGAVQTAMIAKQLSKLADGGLLNGKAHAQGGMRIEGTNIEVEGGEYVINRASTQKNAGLLHYINSQRRRLSPNDIDGYFNHAGSYAESPNFKTMFAQGGQLPAEAAMSALDNDRMLRAIESINMQPVVSVVDIANVQQSVTKVTDWTNTSSF